MHISSAAYITIDRHPYLQLMIDQEGKQIEALVGDIKFSMLQLGYVPLTSRDPKVDWDELLPPIFVPEAPGRQALNLTGFTDDLTIVKLTRTFWEATNSKGYKDGPVKIPNK